MRWLDRRIAHPGAYLTLCTTEKEYMVAMRHCQIKHPLNWLASSHADATCHFLENPDGGAVCVVCIRPKPTTNAIEIAGLLVHEAVHVWQNYCTRIGETNPGIEQEAYGIQSIAQELLAEYATRVTPRKRKP